MTYLITCSGSKRQPSNSYSSSLKLLSFSNELHDTREKLIKLLELVDLFIIYTCKRIKKNTKKIKSLFLVLIFPNG